jgi:hypothetical protein
MLYALLQKKYNWTSAEPFEGKRKGPRVMHGKTGI